VGKLNRQALVVGERIRSETEDRMQSMFNEKEIILFNRYDAEKQELYQQIRELEAQCENFDEFKQKL